MPTADSASVTRDRLDLERKCELAEKKIYRTANDAITLIANLDALANAVGAAPDATVKVHISFDDVVVWRGPRNGCILIYSHMKLFLQQLEA